jgi:gliding motility-associated-like protein
MYVPITASSCNDSNCLTIDSYNATTCACEYVVIPTPSCDDADCATADVYNLQTCTCNYAPATSPSACDDGNCLTSDSYDTVACMCMNTPIAIPTCNDNICYTTDSYNTATCSCVYTTNPIPVCNDSDSTTTDSFDSLTCNCIFTPIGLSDSTFTFSLSDPCACNNNSTINANDGSFSETITVDPTLPIPTGTLIRCNSIVGGDIATPVLMSGTGPFTLTFNHVDMIGYTATNFEYSLNGGVSWMPINDPATGAPAAISNKCAYPNPTIASIANYCITSSASVLLTVNLPAGEPGLNASGIQFVGGGVSAASPWVYTPSTVVPNVSNSILLTYTGTNDGLGGVSPDGGLTPAYPGCLQSSITTTMVYSEPTVTLSTTDAGCGSANGALNITSIINPSYIYTINGAEATPSATGIFSNLPAGTHVLAVIDNSNPLACEKLYNFTISSTSPWTINAIASSPVCGTTGVIDVALAIDPSGAPYTTDGTFNLWNSSATTILQTGSVTSTNSYTFNSVIAGNYVIQVIDINGCAKLLPIAVTCTDPIDCTDTIKTCAPVFPGSVILCVPGCYFDSNDTISVIQSAIHCSIEIKSDSCFSYQALPGMAAGYVDNVTVTFCNAAGVCFDVIYAIELGCINPEPTVEVAPKWVDAAGVSISQINVIGTLNNCLTIPVSAIDPDSADVLTYNLMQPEGGSVSYNASHTAIVYCPSYNSCGKDTIFLMVTDLLAPVQSDVLTIIVSTTCPPIVVPTCNDTSTICMGVFPTTVTICPEFCNLGGVVTIADSVKAHPTFECSIDYPGSGCFEYSPLPGILNYNDTILVVGMDTLGNTDTAIVIVTVQNTPCPPVTVPTPPTANNDLATVTSGDGVTINVLANDTASSPGVINILPGSGPLNGTVFVNPDGSITYTSTDTTFVGTDCFSYTYCNANGCDTAQVCVTVTEDVVNPIASPIAVDNSYVISCCAPNTFNVITNDTLPAGTILTASLFNGPSHGTATIDSVTGIITYVPDSGYTGVDVIVYIICNQDNACDTAVVTIVIDNNLPPVIIDTTTGSPIPEIIFVTIPEDSLFTACNVGVLDPNGDTTSLLITGPINGTWTLDSTSGCWTYTPNPNWSGVDTVLIVACDPSGACDSVTIIINVTPVDDNIVAVNNAYSTSPNVSITFNALLNDYDPDGSVDSTWTVAIIDSTLHGIITINTNNTFTYVPDSAYCGIDTYFYSICDTSGSCDTALVTISVVCPNSAPVALNNTETTPENKPITISVLANDSDPENDSIYVSSYGTPENGIVTFDSITQTFTYTPQQNWTGIDSFFYILCDVADNSPCDTAWVIINVTESKLVVYNGISLNGDGENETFYIQGIDNYKNNKVMIFNRWGVKVFEKDAYTNASGWNGTWQDNGKGLPDGTYYYMIYLDKDKQTKTSTLSGFLTIYRK